MDIGLFTGINSANPIVRGSKKLLASYAEYFSYYFIKLKVQLWEKINLASRAHLTKLRMTRIWLNLT